MSFKHPVMPQVLIRSSVPSLVRSVGIMLAVVLVLSAIVGMSSTHAQGTDPIQINVGESVIGTLNQNNYALVYSFTANAGDKLTFNVSSAGDLRFGVLITNPTGGIIQRSPTQNESSITFTNQEITSAGVSIITILRGGDTSGDFTLTVSGEAAAGATAASTVVATVNGSVTGSGGTTATTSSASVSTPLAPIQLAQGMTISLTWQTADDMNVEVRDPIGGTVNFRSTTADNGTLNGNVNAACENTTASNATESVSYPAGTVPAGSYEVIIYYAQACVVPAQPVAFTLTVNVNGVAQPAITATIPVNSQYVTSFNLASANNIVVRQGGDPVNATLDLARYRADIQAALLLTTGTNVTGKITAENPVDAWSYTGTAGQLISVSMDATSGSLDTLLLVLASNGIGVASNDDADATTRNARIVSFRLPADGQYTVLATRFGLNIGGTEGDYTLTLTTGDTPAATAAVPTPGIAITVTPPVVTPASGATAAATTASTGSATTPTVGTASTPVPTQASDPANAVTTLQGLAAGSIQVVLTWNSPVDLRLLVRDTAGTSIYTDNPSVRNSGILQEQGNLNCANLTSTPRSYIYFPQTRPQAGTYEVQVWEQSACNEVAPPTFNLQVFVSGQEVINVNDQPDATTIPSPHYVTNFTVNADGTAAAIEGQIFFGNFLQDFGTGADVQAAIPTSTGLTVNTPTVFNIDQGSPYQVYTFAANAGDRVRVTMRNVRGSLDPYLFLLDLVGQQVASNDDIGNGDRNSQIEYTVPAQGNYVIYATRYGGRTGGTVGRYELSLRLVNR